MRLRVLLIGALSSAFATASFASMITNGTFSIAGTIFVTGAGGVTTPAGVCPSGVSCIFFQDTGAPAQNGKIDISPLSLPSGDIPLAIAGNDAGNIQSLINPPDTPPSFPAVNFISFTNAGITTVLRVNSFPLGINSPAGCAATPPAADRPAAYRDRRSICRILPPRPPRQHLPWAESPTIRALRGPGFSLPSSTRFPTRPC